MTTGPFRPEPTPAFDPPQALIFDLDGTLVDSLQDIAESVNACLELLGFPPRPLESYRYMVGEGIELLCQRALGKLQPIYVKRLTDLARAYYRLRCLVHTRPYEGIRTVISTLKAAGLQLAVLSNKPHDMTNKIVRALWPENPFRIVRGNLDPQFRKPDPQAAWAILAELGVPPSRAWLIGDTPTDVRTAANAGMRPVGVSWGFRTAAELAEAGAEWIVAEPAKLLGLPGMAHILTDGTTAP